LPCSAMRSSTCARRADTAPANHSTTEPPAMDAPRTLLYVITGTGIGGAEKALCELVERRERSRFRVVVCSLKRSGAYASRLTAHADAFHDLGLDDGAGLRAALRFIPATLRLAGIMRHEKARIVHCFMFRASLMGRLAACLCPGASVIAAVRVKEQEGWKYLLERVTRALVDRYTAVSEEVRRGMIERAHVDPGRIITIHNGIDCAGVAMRADGCAQVPVRIALIGRLHPQKGHIDMLEALKHIIDVGRQVHLCLAGEGPDETLLRQRARELGIASAVTFAGVVDDTLAFMAGIDIVVLPSLWEGMPNVLLEAMAAGLPIVASRLGGIEELVRHEESALLCEPGNPAELAAALVRLVDDPRLARALALAARRDAEERFDIARTVGATQALYESVARRVQRRGS